MVLPSYRFVKGWSLFKAVVQAFEKLMGIHFPLRLLKIFSKHPLFPLAGKQNEERLLGPSSGGLKL